MTEAEEKVTEIVKQVILEAEKLCKPDERFVGITYRDGKIRTVVLYQNMIGEKG